MNILKKIYYLLPDSIFLRICYKRKIGKKLNLNNPQSFNEKLQWLKLYDRRPEYQTMVDKRAVKDYVACILGKEHVIQTLGVWESPDDIDFDALPAQFVLKTINGGGGSGVVICKNKETFDKKEAIERLHKSLQVDIYKLLREWPYKNIKKQIIAEKYMEDEAGELKDYKFFCFNGTVKCFKIDFDRYIEHHANYYNPEGQLLPFGELLLPPIPDKKIEIPDSLPEMIRYAEMLSKGYPFMRVDFYSVCNHIYFGEITFYPASGFGKFTNDEWDIKIGEWLELPKI